MASKIKKRKVPKRRGAAIKLQGAQFRQRVMVDKRARRRVDRWNSITLADYVGWGVK